MSVDRTYRAVSRADLAVEQVDDELLVYDRAAHAAHCLAGTAAAVWLASQDGASLNDLIEAARPHCRTESDDAEQLALAAVGELQSKKLIEITVSDGVSRRQILGRIAGAGTAAALTPLVISVAMPASAAAMASPGGTCVATGATGCTGTGYSANNCCTGNDFCNPNNTKCVTCVPANTQPFASGGGRTPCTTANMFECCSGTCSGNVCA